MRRRFHQLTRWLLPAAVAGLTVISLITSSCKENNSSPTGPGPGGGGTPPAGEIWMRDTRFTPDTMSVNAGTTIRWINKDTMPHTVTSGIPGHPDGFFNSGSMSPGDTFRFTFQSSRTTYHYYCMFHAVQMQATVTVR